MEEIELNKEYKPFKYIQNLKKDNYYNELIKKYIDKYLFKNIDDKKLLEIEKFINFLLKDKNIDIKINKKDFSYEIN